MKARVRETWTSRTSSPSSTLDGKRYQSLDESFPATATAAAAEASGSSRESAASEKAGSVLQFQISDDELPMRLSSVNLQNSSSNAVTIDRGNSVSTSSIALASPSGMILEREAQTNGSIDSTRAEPDALTVTRVNSSGSSPTSSDGFQKGSPEQSGAPTPSMAMSKLKWRRGNIPEDTKSRGGGDERGVTICALPGDNRYNDELEDGEKVDNIDETIPFVRD